MNNGWHHYSARHWNCSLFVYLARFCAKNWGCESDWDMIPSFWSLVSSQEELSTHNSQCGAMNKASFLPVSYCSSVLPILPQKCTSNLPLHSCGHFPLNGSELSILLRAGAAASWMVSLPSLFSQSVLSSLSHLMSLAKTLTQGAIPWLENHERVWLFYGKWNIELSYNPAILPLGIYPKWLITGVQTKTGTLMFM